MLHRTVLNFAYVLPGFSFLQNGIAYRPTVHGHYQYDSTRTSSNVITNKVRSYDVQSSCTVRSLLYPATCTDNFRLFRYVRWPYTTTFRTVRYKYDDIFRYCYNNLWLPSSSATAATKGFNSGFDSTLQFLLLLAVFNQVLMQVLLHVFLQD